MTIERIACGQYAANAYLVYEEQEEEALLIDAGDDLPSILGALLRSGKRLGAAVLTHGHFDHVLTAGRLRKATGAQLLIGAGDGEYLLDKRLNCYDAVASSVAFEPCRADRLLEEGTVTLAGMALQVLMTPGHTPGGLCLMSEHGRALFTGDTLFANGYGRLDLPGGDAGAMRDSLRKLFALSDDLTVYPGHGAPMNLGRIKEAWEI